MRVDRTVHLRGSPGIRTFDRTWTCDDQRSWGERRQEYAMRGRHAAGALVETPSRLDRRSDREEGRMANQVADVTDTGTPLAESEQIRPDSIRNLPM